MAERRVSLEEIAAAGRVLFGPTFAAGRAGWREELKAAYRQRALETHPDRAQAVGRSEAELSSEFRKVTEAYRVLSALRPGRPARAAPARPVHAAGAPRQPARPTASRRAGEGPRSDLPRRRLRLAEYLYYSGRIPWSAFMDAIAWQRRQRPALGRLAVEKGYLTPEQVSRLLDLRRARGAQGVPIGEFAVREGYLTPFQLLSLLGRQLRLQRRIGEFFVEQGLIARDEIDELRRRIALHNARQPR